MKKFISLFLVFVFILSVGACSNNSVPETEETITNENVTQSVPPTTTEPVTETTTEATTEPVPLSADCDKIIASGYDNDGNYYELVGTEKQEYNGTIIKLGVIKNNEWLVPLTTDMPFIDEANGLIRSCFDEEGTYSLKDLDSPWYRILYIGHGCFYSGYQNVFDEQIVYNSNNQKYVSLKDEDNFIVSSIVINKTGNWRTYGDFSEYGLSTELFIPKEGKYLINGGTRILDVTTMEISPTGFTTYIDKATDGMVFPYSEGLFCYINIRYDNVKQHNGFYNANGEKVIDLSEYDLRTTTADSKIGLGNYGKQALIFENGEVTFRVLNEAGYEFEITMDKTGKVIDSKQVTF